jgi:tetrathionate reductase subunit B
MGVSRRSFLGFVGGGVAGVAVAGSARAATSGAPRVPSDGHRPRWGMVIDLRRCIGCQACTVACAMENDVPLGQARTYVSSYDLETPGGTRRVHLPRMCNHCEDPPCLAVCPTGATYQRDDGAVVIDNSRCVGCGYCTQACPYGARFMNEDTLTADKCTFCVHRLDAGLLPACVETCVGGARIFGDLNDPDSEVSRLLASQPVQVLKPAEGTEPRVFYIGLNEEVRGVVDGEARPSAGTHVAEPEEVPL